MFGLKTRLFGGEPRAYRQEIGGAGSNKTSNAAGLAAGLVAGTMVATTTGWRPVEAIAPGDQVLSFDHGLQSVRDVTRGVHWDGQGACPKALQPLAVPAGALGNQDPIMLLPEQGVILESDTGDMLFGDPFTMLNAGDLDGLRGIERIASVGQLDVVQLHFDEDEVVFANAGALVFCPSQRVIDVDELLCPDCEATRYSPLCAEQAALMLDCLIEEDLVSTGATPENTGPLLYAACA